MPSLPSISASLLAAALLAGCADLAYYAQAVGGQSAVMQAARTIPEWLAEPDREAALRSRLEQAQAIRAFASRELALPDNGSYQRYADLGRPYVVWNVFAAPEFSIDLEKWCFIFVGCLPYRGYFDQADAENFARELRAQGRDTYVAGVAAYSTLGIYADPLLNTFLRLGDERTARTIFHELAHQRLFVKGDPTFSESFASAVEEEGLRRWLTAQADTPGLLRLDLRRERQSEFDRQAGEIRKRLRDLYASSATAEEKRQVKAELLAELQGRASELVAAPAPVFNNARVGSLGLYRRWVPAFRALLRATGGDLPTFYRQAGELARLPAKEREAALSLLAREAGPSHLNIDPQRRGAEAQR